MDSHKTTDDIFNDALELSPGERGRFVESACAGNSRLHAEVLALLAADDAADDFMASPPVVFVGDEQSVAGMEVGPYRLCERVGTGGTGDVYLAERVGADYEQRVAIKILRGAVFQSESLRRFRNECRFLARLEHPNIARMIEGGFTGDGVPYIAMEYVEGDPIDRYCESNEISVNERLLLFCTVCSAVQHIHQHSTIHRDVKPANILVTSDGEIKLVDFGIARALDVADDENPQTATGLEMMTPQYASPEQLRGDVLTTATDVYSLGVVLYKLLTGQLPFAAKSRSEMERLITDTAPTRPSTVVLDARTRPQAGHPRQLSRRLRGDLDTIVLKALHREPDRRYPSAEQLVEDIRRHIDGRPVVARGDTFAYRATKLVRRNALAVSAVAIFVLTLTAAAITGFYLFVRAERARVEAVRERTTTERVSVFLQDLLAAVDPGEAGTRPDVTVREALDEASRHVQGGLSDQPAVAAALNLTIGKAYLNLGVFEKAQAHLDTATTLFRSLDPPNPNGELQALSRLGQLAEKRGDYTRAETCLLNALAVYDRNPDADVAAAADVEMTMARLYATVSRLEEAEDHARRGRDLAATITDPRSALPAQTMSELAVVEFRMGRYEEADALLATAVTMVSDALGDRHVLTGEILQNRAVVLGTMGRSAEAIDYYERALAVYDAAYPANHPEIGTTRLNLADAYMTTGRFADAAATYASARAILRDAYGDGHLQVGLAANGEAMATWKLQGPAPARPLFEEAIANMRASLGDDHPWVATPMNNLARVTLELGDLDGARRLAESSLAIMRTAYPEGHLHLTRPLSVIGEVCLVEGRPSDALLFFDEAWAHCGAVPATNTDRLTVCLDRSSCLVALGRFEEAEDDLLRTYAATDSALDASDGRLARTRSALAALYEAWGRPADARRYQPLR